MLYHLMENCQLLGCEKKYCEKNSTKYKYEYTFLVLISTKMSNLVLVNQGYHVVFYLVLFVSLIYTCVYVHTLLDSFFATLASRLASYIG